MLEQLLISAGGVLSCNSLDARAVYAKGLCQKPSPPSIFDWTPPFFPTRREALKHTAIIRQLKVVL